MGAYYIHSSAQDHSVWFSRECQACFLTIWPLASGGLTLERNVRSCFVDYLVLGRATLAHGQSGYSRTEAYNSSDRLVLYRSLSHSFVYTCYTIYYICMGLCTSYVSVQESRWEKGGQGLIVTKTFIHYWLVHANLKQLLNDMYFFFCSVYEWQSWSSC